MTGTNQGRAWTEQLYPDLQVIYEAAGGLEAVQKAEELKPDLVLLDVGLPTPRICKLAAESKIVFVSQETSADVIEQAPTSGAKGYIMKTSVARDLLPAMEAVLEGRQFVSRPL